MRRQPGRREKIFANYLSVKGLIAKTYKELIKFNSKIAVQSQGGRESA